ncbi:MAG: type II toxin-antitoxin system RelE/ParE family toxin [Patescibacteria group bacterium]
MEGIYEIIFQEAVLKIDVPKISRAWRVKIIHSIDGKLRIHPEIFGKPLRYSLKNHRVLRVGDYRVVFRIDGSAVVVILIEHRSVVYELIKKRIQTK